jgi:zinc metalloprotease ZmpB
MFEEFHQTLRTKIRLDAERIPRDLIHEEHFRSSAGSARQAAREYLHSHGDLIGTGAGELKNLGRHPENELVDAGIEYRFHTEKPQFGATTVAYYQTVFGLPIWEAGLAVHMKHAPFRIVGAQTTRHAKIKITKPSARARGRLKDLSADALTKLLGITGSKTEFEAGTLRVLRRRLMIYRYEASKRLVRPRRVGKARKEPALDHPTLPLPPVKRGITDGRHYVVAALDFRTASRNFGVLHWIALVEAETLSVLYLRALVDHVCGMVFQTDPMTLAGGPDARAESRTLNRLRHSAALSGLDAPHDGSCALCGDIIEIRDFEPPPAAPPTQPVGKSFDYPARSNQFAAVNAYYNCDRFFRLVEELGFPRASYFKPTKFPVPVDHRGRIDTQNGIEINARCMGNTTAEGGLLNVRFALADTHNTADPLGIACDWRVVLHELGGHGILWNHINFGMFKFAHSTGDSFAAILNDPESYVRDSARFVTFPWIPFLKRHHNRKVAQGWGWGGKMDLGVDPNRALDPKGYQSEQILSTTHFRIYRAIGGDSEKLAMRHFAARFVPYLILRAVGSLTPAHPPEHVAAYAAALMIADAFDWTSEGQTGGAYAKVIRWAFEKQGLYQRNPHARAVTREGAPPLVDVYIEDGRRGEYRYQPRYWNSRAIWNRRAADRGTAHQMPVAGVTNFAYVKIKNRGTTTASGVTVKAFHYQPSAGQIYPDDWRPMTTTELPAPDVPPNSTREITVGPFEWTPTDARDCTIMVATAPGDASNIGNFERGKSIPEWRLVPHDNNIGQRNEVVIDGGAKDLIAAFAGTRITVKNPGGARARMLVNAVLPPFLVRRGWRLAVIGAGGKAFWLKPGASRDVVLKLKAGKRGTVKQIGSAQNRRIHLEVLADDILVGGMTYTFSAGTRARSPSKPSRS